MMQQNLSHSSRSKYLNNLEDFLETARDSLRNFTETLGWSEIKDVTDVPSNSGMTRSPEKSNEFNDEPLLPALPVKGVSAVTIDADVQRNVLAAYRRPDAPDLRQPPLAAGELIANFSRQERLALYEYTLQNAAGMAPPPELSMMENAYKKEAQPKELSGLELAKAMRDFKRRRQAYRTKVSTKNKSHTEVAREIIHNMMVFIGATDLETDAPHQTSEPRDEIGKEEQHPSDQKEHSSQSKKESASSSRGEEDSSPFRRSHDCGDGRDRRDRRKEQEGDSRYDRRVNRHDSIESRKRNRGEGREQETAYRRTNSRERCDYEAREYRKNNKWEGNFDEVRDDKQVDRRREREGEYRREKEGVYRGRSREERSWEERGREKVKEQDKRCINEFEKDYYKERKERERHKYYSEYYHTEEKERKYETEREQYSDKLEGKYGERNEKEFKKRIKVEKDTEDGELSSSESERRGSSDEGESTWTDRKKKRKMKKKKSKRKHKKKKSKSSHRHSSKSDSENLSSEEEDQRYEKVEGYVKEEKK
ncbi:U11/U12 small nuclear ribonucleoprotein 48 kDa protein-like [Penaeus monodon]|uniref:U11/U12 small nuclear ribonucleoprotein 48 kDa protein-like n=1 Tax=Penaeus monodon TaxID=6687 RepID=UPI0018A6F4A9|nr:U11/U12 small nuclear ribonucleoprotein 48 kDa protein-like [Penaeus monodon]